MAKNRTWIYLVWDLLNHWSSRSDHVIVRLSVGMADILFSEIAYTFSVDFGRKAPFSSFRGRLLDLSALGLFWTAQLYLPAEFVGGNSLTGFTFFLRPAEVEIVADSRILRRQIEAGRTKANETDNFLDPRKS